MQTYVDDEGRLEDVGCYVGGDKMTVELERRLEARAVNKGGTWACVDSGAELRFSGCGGLSIGIHLLWQALSQLRQPCTSHNGQ
jgi:hypothetical protein